MNQSTPSPNPNAATTLDFQVDEYQHWQIELNAPVAKLLLNVDEQGGAFDGYALKMNSYDIGVDIELNSIVQKLRFEHPEIKTVVLGSAKTGSWCAGANIRMLAQSEHQHKVNFCKLTNETRNAMEDASRFSNQTYMAAIDGTAAGGGYELALATEYLVLIDDGNAAVSLPEIPMLAVLPGTGGLTRLVDKRKVRKDLADVFSTVEEGVRGARAVSWRLVDESIPRSRFQARIDELAQQFARDSDRPDAGGVELTTFERSMSRENLSYKYLDVQLAHDQGTATFTIKTPDSEAPRDVAALEARGAEFWPLALMRELDDAILHLRFNEGQLGTWIFKSQGNPQTVKAYDDFLQRESKHWLVREIQLFIKRTYKRLDVSARSLFTLIEPGSCFSGFLTELVFAADRSYMLEGVFEDTDDHPAPATISLSQSNFDIYPMVNGLSRLQSRFWGEPESLEASQGLIGKDLLAEEALAAHLITFALDDIDWEDEIRLLIEERKAYSPDALTGMEANLRFPGPETMESKIFARLTAWQNWIFQRSNAVGPEGALRSYGSGKRAKFDNRRV